jgi:Helix-turn-helix of DDE superfamily endonuclease
MHRQPTSFFTLDNEDLSAPRMIRQATPKLQAVTDNARPRPELRGSTIDGMRLRLARCTSADLRSWTGLTGPQMQHLVQQLWQLKPGAGRGRRWALPFADRVLLVVLAYRTNLTMQQLGSLFGIFHAAAHRGPPPESSHVWPNVWLSSSAHHLPTAVNYGSWTTR